MIDKKDKYNVSVVGATGAVGRRMLAALEERNFPVSRLSALASARSVGQKLPFRGGEIEVKELQEDSFMETDIALFSAGSSISKKYAPIAVESGCVAIDNSSAWRMEKGVPLIVPEVNPSALGEKYGIIANPNCSTIQMVVALKPLHDRYRVRRVVVSTYQSVSGSGQKAIEELKQQSRKILDGEPVQCNVYPHQIAFNCLPHIDTFMENGYTKEEMKMVDETRKILGDNTIEVSPTAVRVPVCRHSSRLRSPRHRRSSNGDRPSCLRRGFRHATQQRESSVPGRLRLRVAATWLSDPRTGLGPARRSRDAWPPSVDRRRLDGLPPSLVRVFSSVEGRGRA